MQRGDSVLLLNVNGKLGAMGEEMGGLGNGAGTSSAAAVREVRKALSLKTQTPHFERRTREGDDEFEAPLERENGDPTFAYDTFYGRWIAPPEPLPPPLSHADRMGWESPRSPRPQRSPRTPRGWAYRGSGAARSARGTRPPLQHLAA